MGLLVNPRERRAAVGGLVGPIAFVGAWVGCGLAAGHYSPVDDAISQLARLGASTRVAMTAGFVVYGVALPVYAWSLRAALAGRAWIAVGITGLATLGVAAFPLGFSDPVHDAFAGVGYVSLAAAPLLAAPAFRAVGFRRAAIASVVLGLSCAACLLLSTTTGPTGLFQRTGLTIGDVWLVAGATTILVRGGFRRSGPGG
jgi:hypothetical membrane protein